MWIFLIALLSLFSPQLSTAQENDTLRYQRVLLIAFNPEYYLSDAEQDLQKQNKRTPDEYRKYMRCSLDNKIAAAIEGDLSCYSLLSDTSQLALETSWDFYNRSGLAYVSPYGNSRATVKPLRSVKSEKATDPHNAIKYDQMHGDIKCMDNTVKDSVWLKEFSRQYECDLLLSVNQFEIKTNYNSCIDIANKVYKREVLVHYTLMTPSGKRLQGNVAIASFASNHNRVEEISEKVFPEIAAAIAVQVRNHL